MAQDFLNQSDRDVQRLVEDLEDVIRSPLENDMASVKQETAAFKTFKPFSETFTDRRKIPKPRLEHNFIPQNTFIPVISDILT